MFPLVALWVCRRPPPSPGGFVFLVPWRVPSCGCVGSGSPTPSEWERNLWSDLTAALPLRKCDNPLCSEEGTEMCQRRYCTGTWCSWCAQGCSTSACVRNWHFVVFGFVWGQWGPCGVRAGSVAGTPLPFRIQPRVSGLFGGACCGMLDCVL